VDRAPSGAVIVLRSGSYHESVLLPAGKRLTVQAFPGEKVWFDGRKAVAGWKSRGSVWVATNWNQRFDSSPTYTKGAPDNSEDGWRFVSASHPMAAHPDQVWLGDRKLRQVRSRSAVVGGTFFVDSKRRELVLGTKPGGRTVRASTLQRAITIKGQAVRVRGVGVRGYATSVWQGGAVIVGGDNTKLENMVISDNATTGLSVAASDVTLAGVTVQGNGMLGVNAHHADGLFATDLLVARNNLEQFNIAPSAGGMKMTASRRVLVTRSDFVHNIGHGLWFDASCYDVTLVKLKARSNVGSGIRLEISSRVLVVGSSVTANGLDGLRIVNTDRVEVANNTLARNSGRNLAITTDQRRASVKSAPGHDSRNPDDTSMTWLSDDITVYNNVISGGGGGCVVCVLDTRRQRLDQVSVRFDSNYYQRRSAAAPKIFATWPSETGPLQFVDLATAQAATGQDQHSFLSQSPTSAVDEAGELSQSTREAASRVARGLTDQAADASGEEAGSRYLGAWS
jgi:hypothetical protein